LTYFSTGSSAGYLMSYPLNLTPGESIPITIGNGGLQNQNGGTTTFGSYLSCSGGLASPAGNMAGGNCGSNGGFGVTSQFVGIGAGSVDYGGGFLGGQTPFGYGSGGNSFKCWGCGLATVGAATPGMSGVVFIDVLY
jgi:hypothetical protein